MAYEGRIVDPVAYPSSGNGKYEGLAVSKVKFQMMCENKDLGHSTAESK
jgi:hypothetical protein